MLVGGYSREPEIQRLYRGKAVAVHHRKVWDAARNYREAVKRPRNSGLPAAGGARGRVYRGAALGQRFLSQPEAPFPEAGGRHIDECRVAVPLAAPPKATNSRARLVVPRM
jgi:hypothetical protein